MRGRTQSPNGCGIPRIVIDSLLLIVCCRWFDAIQVKRRAVEAVGQLFKPCRSQNHLRDRDWARAHAGDAVSRVSTGVSGCDLRASVSAAAEFRWRRIAGLGSLAWLQRGLRPRLAAFSRHSYLDAG